MEGSSTTSTPKALPPGAAPFEQHAARYDAWYERRFWTYVSELHALRSVLPEFHTGIEIGVGTGRFAGPLGIKMGVEPSPEMARIARRRGIEVIDGVAEDLPFGNATFDLVLVLTVLCFLKDVPAAFREINRILEPGGALVIGMIDRDSPAGQELGGRKAADPFFREANLYSASGIAALLADAGFEPPKFRQTVFNGPDSEYRPESVMDGHGLGMFVVLKTTKMSG